MGELSLDIGLKALLTSKAALDTIGHNIANANTPGYSRQDLHVSSGRAQTLRGLRIGDGVQADFVTRTVDELVNRRLVAQLGVMSRLEANVVGLSDLEALFGEPGEGGLGSILNGLFERMAELSAQPGERLQREGVVEAASQLTGRFHDLAGDVRALRDSTVEQAKLVAKDVDRLAAEIFGLGREIAAVESGGVVANDLRDQREQALRELASKIDVTYHETPSGHLQVFADGQMLVGESRAATVDVRVGDDGTLEVSLSGGVKPLEVKGGELGALVGLHDKQLPGVIERVDALARALILEMNRVHATGAPLDGGFRRLDAESAVVDSDGDGQLEDELLGYAGLPLEIEAGELQVHVTSVATGAVQTHRIAIDPATMTVGDLVDALGSLPGIGATLDGSGHLQLVADDGYRFDFSHRLDRLPDDAGTFGGARATLGSGAGPFDLSGGGALDLDGPLGPFTVTLDPSDFADPAQATAAEVAAAINAEPGTTANSMRAVAVGAQVFLQTLDGGSATGFDVVGGSAAGALGFVAGTSVTGQEAEVAVELHGTYTGGSSGSWTFRPTGDGAIGTTPGLGVEVRDGNGTLVATLDVGAGYVPGAQIAIADGLSVSFGAGAVSATDGDAFGATLAGEPDTAGLLVAFGLNGLFTGTDAQSIELRADIAANPSLLAASGNGDAGDNGVLLELIGLQERVAGELGATFDAFYGDLVGDVGQRIDSAKSSLESERYLVDSLESRRQEVSGVNVDEELVAMIQYEQAFAAAAQFIQVVNSLSEEILNLV